VKKLHFLLLAKEDARSTRAEQPENNRTTVFSTECSTGFNILDILAAFHPNFIAQISDIAAKLGTDH
jgi:hypothetical protein